jgi:hypothetical protein
MLNRVAVALPWVERVANDYLDHGPRAVGFSELGRDERLAVLTMASELQVDHARPHPYGQRRRGAA